uniref:Uncharacterized protein n=1 Tax=Anopheles maculatus TaxID=74869 RepID=A0A182SIA5_9DIPT
MTNLTHRFTADGQSPSSASASNVSGGFISSISTVSMPSVTQTQSNEPYISSSGNSDAGLAVTAPTCVEDGSPPSISKGAAAAIPDDCTNNDDEESTTVTTALYTGRPLLKHKLFFNDDENDPSSTMKPVKIRLTEHATISETNETVTAAGVGELGYHSRNCGEAP